MPGRWYTQRAARHRDIHMDMDMDIDMVMDMGANVQCWRVAIIQRESSSHLAASCRLRLLAPGALAVIKDY
eukprot:4529506-Prymnesium_polylepis.1